jgi:hypothetical protein
MGMFAKKKFPVVIFGFQKNWVVTHTCLDYPKLISLVSGPLALAGTPSSWA